jgi:hypothetical protein
MTTMKKHDAPEPHPPSFSSEQEAAEFWDEHSPLDFPDDFEEVELQRATGTRKRALTVRLDQATLERISEIAAEKGIEPGTLARMWILEHLKAG